MVYIDKLHDTRAKRQKIQEELQILRERIVKSETDYLNRELGIKIEFEHEVQRAIAEIAKVKYSNAERRKVEFEKLLIADLNLNEIKGALESYKKLEQRYMCDDQILKLEERYLFKEIELFIALKNFDAAKLKIGM